MFIDLISMIILSSIKAVYFFNPMSLFDFDFKQLFSSYQA